MQWRGTYTLAGDGARMAPEDLSNPGGTVGSVGFAHPCEDSSISSDLLVILGD